MGTTTSVSRRLVLVKTKRKRAPPKPKAMPDAPARENDTLIDDDFRHVAPVAVRRAAAQAQPKATELWLVVTWWAGGLAALAALVTVFVVFAGRFYTPPEAPPVATNSWNSPGYSRSTNRGGATGGSPGGGTGYSGPRQSTASGFLASPFNKRKNTQITCTASVGGGKEAASEFTRCLQQASEAEEGAAPAKQ